MKSLFASVLVFAFCISVGHGIKCYQCNSDKSWEDCVFKNDTTCSSDSEACFKGHFEAEKDIKTIKAYSKECSTKAICDNGCKAIESLGYKVKTCDINCCETDLCNGAKVLMVSGFLFLACALVAFL